MNGIIKETVLMKKRKEEIRTRSCFCEISDDILVSVVRVCADNGAEGSGSVQVLTGATLGAHRLILAAVAGKRRACKGGKIYVGRLPLLATHLRLK